MLLQIVADVLDKVLAETRGELSQLKSTISRAELTSTIASKVAERIRETLQPSLKRVINASGVVLHTNLGRAPLGPQNLIAGYSNLEYDLASGKIALI